MSFISLPLLLLLLLFSEQDIDPWFDGSTLMVVVPDAARSRERWLASPYHRMVEALADEEIGHLAGVAWQEGLGQLQELTWIDPLPLLEDLRQWRFNAVIRGDAVVDTHTAVRLISRAAEVFQAVAEQPGGHLSEDGTQIICPAGSITARDGDELSYHVPGQPLPDYGPALALFADDDLGISFVLSLADDLDGAAQAKRSAILGEASTLRLLLGLALGEDGTRLRLVVPDQRLIGPLRPVERAALAPLPANTLAVMAMGIDMRLALDRVLVDHALRWSLSRLVDQDVDDAAGLLVALGLDSDDPALGQGTMVVAVNPGLPLPHVTLGLPADALIDALLVRAGVDITAAGRAPVRIDQGPRPMHLRRGPQGWGIGTSPALAELLAVGGRDRFWSGRLANEMAVDDGDHLVIGADVRQVLTMTGSLMRIAAGLGGDDVPAEVRLLAPAINAIAPHARHAVLRFGYDDNSTVLTMRNVLPIGLGLAALGWQLQSGRSPDPVLEPPGLLDFGPE